MERPTYAGLKVDVLEGLNGQLVVEHEGQLIPSQEAPPRPNILRGVNGYPSHAPLDRKGLGGRWVRVLASLDRERAEAIDGNHDNGAAKIRKKATSVPRKPTPKQIARWEAVHAAKRRGLSIRGITRETGIHRNTVRKYLKADSPPMNRPRVVSKASQSVTVASQTGDIYAGQLGGHLCWSSTGGSILAMSVASASL